MAKRSVAAGTQAGAVRVAVRTIGVADLKDALAKGIEDFKAMPSHAVFLGVIYPVIGVVLLRAALGLDLWPLLFPLAAGLGLVGPFFAIGLYELSRRREQGLDAAPWHAFRALRMCGANCLALGAMLAVVFLAWLATAQGITVLVFGDAAPASLGAFLREVFTTQAGWTLLAVGTGVGVLFAAAIFSISVVSFPLLLDRKVSAVEAVAISIRAVRASPVTMAVWGAANTAALVIGSLPVFIGLVVVMPVLGHASWHLYRKVIPPLEGESAPGRRSRPSNKRALRTRAA